MRVLLGIAAIGCTGGADDPREDRDPTGVSDTGTAPGPDTSVPPDTAPAEPPGWRWARIEVSGVAPRWGAVSAGPLLIGGVDGAMAVTPQILALAASGAGIDAEPRAALSVPRYCACALVDPARDEVLVIGGRNESFRESASVELISLAAGEPVPLDPAGADDHPVGCHAFFSEAHDRGWIVGGYGAGAGFGATTWRYDPAAREIVALDVPGPPGRYDAGIQALPDGSFALVGGMGADGFDSQVWRFDPATESWAEVPVSSGAVPPGRRFPWTAVHGDTLLYGYGTDSPMGASVLGDLWAFDLAAGTWEELAPDGERPAARSFAPRLPGPPGSVGVLAFGVDGNLDLFDDAWALRGP